MNGSCSNAPYVGASRPTRCPYCDSPFAGGRPATSGLGKLALTLDHIVPREWGGGGMVAPGVSNLRASCNWCNQHRALCGHCVVIMACVQAVASDPAFPMNGVRKMRKRRHVLARWWMKPLRTAQRIATEQEGT